MIAVTHGRERSPSRGGGPGLVAAAVLAAVLLAACGPIAGAPGSGNAAATATVPASASAALPLAGKVSPLASSAYLGVYVPPAPFDASRIDAYVSSSGKTPAIVMWYQPWATDNEYKFDAAACWRVLKRGAVPMITWEPWDPGMNAPALNDPAAQPAFALRNILAGTYDTYIRTWARQIRDLGGPIMLRPMHEMNGTWYPWAGTVNGNSPADYVAAWRHIHDIFAAEGATNVTWVWSVNDRSLPKTAVNGYAAYYPGDAYVDWAGVSGFNWGTSAGQKAWVTWRNEYAPVLAYLRTLSKPIFITETGCTEMGGDKAAWLLATYADIQTVPQIGGVVYYDTVDHGIHGTQDWRIDTTLASLAAFQQAIAPAYYVGSAPGALDAWLSSLSPADRARLDAIPPIY